MNFKQAIEEMKKGKKVRRKGWKDVWFTLDNGGALLRNVPGPYNKKATITGLEPLTLESVENVYANDWEVVEEKKEKKTWWKPEMWQKYYQIDWDGRVFDMTYDDTSGDRGSISIGNCFQTVEQAKFMVEKLRVIHELEKFAFENNEEEIISNFKNILKTMYFLRMEIKSKKIEVVSSPTHKYLPFNIYFSSEEIARKAIETIGEERIKKYYFGVEDE